MPALNTFDSHTVAPNILAFDTSTDVMSIAVGKHLGSANEQVWTHTGPGAAQSSSSLLPAIQDLMAQAGLNFEALDAIAFGAGPGSFTGLRTSCAVAQGLGFASGRPVLGIDSLMAVAEEARAKMGSPTAAAVLAMLDARMDEMYTGYYHFDSKQWLSDMPKRLVKPEDLADAGQWTPAGNVFAPYGHRLPEYATALTPIEALPTASAMLRLAPALLAAGHATPAALAHPVYVRDKVAQTTQERAALRAAAEAASSLANALVNAPPGWVTNAEGQPSP